MADHPPAPPMRYTSNISSVQPSSHASKPLPNTPIDDDKKKRKIKMPWGGSKSEDKGRWKERSIWDFLEQKVCPQIK